MIIAVGFISVFILGLLALSIFKKHVLMNLAIILLCLGAVITYETGGYPGSFFFDSALACLIGYETLEISKLRRL